MKRARKFLGMPASDRRLLASAFLAIAWVRIHLAVFRFRVGHGYTLSRKVSQTPGRSPERIAWSVDLASRHLGNATCLVRAMTTQLLLARHGFPSQVHIGVAAGADFSAHAWVDCGGQILIGGPEASLYRPLLAWGNGGVR